VQQVSGLVGIVFHWTAGGPKASALDKEHYHYIVQQDGQIVSGFHAPEDNLNTRDGDYAAHTLNANTGRIGVALCGMMGAVERPFMAGPAPINWPQINALCGLLADLCRRYDIPVTRQTVLSHAEVQPTLGIAQRGKWDVAWLPGMAATGSPVEIGDRIRGDVLRLMKGA
jgi:N-acetyl-anhydromuramyl-L-alanine amidase AmpD